MFPVRCFTCGKVFQNEKENIERELNEYVCANKEKSERWIVEQLDMKTLLEKYHIDRVCCKRMFVAHTNFPETLKLHLSGVHGNLSEMHSKSQVSPSFIVDCGVGDFHKHNIDYQNDRKKAADVLGVD